MDTGTAGVEINELVSSLSESTMYHWRVRLLYHPVTTPFQQYSRWLTTPWNGWQEEDLRTSAEPDSDGDGIPDSYDNCPLTPNPGQEDVGDGDGVGDACDNCPDDANEDQLNSDADTLGDACDNCPAVTNEDQADIYPPLGNGCGDACECEGNFDNDPDVDGTDASTFKADFGRSGFNDPCNELPLCKGNFDCDLDVDGSDASQFKSDFGRSGFQNPCPSCMTDPWCSYL
jgi:hypothetical protein